MMKFKTNLMLALTACASSMLFMLSCGDSVVEAEQEPANDPIAKTATLNVTVRDNSDGKTVPGAAVTILTEGGRTGTSSSNGTVTFKDVHVGTHNLLIKKTGYAEIKYAAVIERDDKAIENFYIAQESSVDYTLYPLTSTLDGYLYYSKDGQSLPASAAKVRISLDANIIGRVDTVRTNAYGYFKFVSLPAVGTDYMLTAMEFSVSGKTYRNTVFSGTRPALTANADEHVTSKFEYSSDITPFIYLGSSPLTIDRNQPIVLDFSDTIDIEKTAVNPVTVSPQQAWDVTYAYKKITITPRQDWHTSGGIVTIAISNRLVSVRGNSFDGTSITVNVKSDDLGSTPVKGLALYAVPHRTHTTAVGVSTPHFYSSFANVTWKKLPGVDVTDYQMFYKAEGSGAYLPVSFLWSDVTSNDTAAFATIHLNNPSAPIGGKTNTFVVQAYNGRSRSALVGADTLELFSRPTVTLSETGYTELTKPPQDSVISWAPNQASFEAGLYTALQSNNPSSLGGMILTFTEPMDNTVNPVGTWVNVTPTGGNARITVNAQWGDAYDRNKETKLRVTIDVAGGTGVGVPDPQLNAIFRFAGLKSAKGKDFFIEYTSLPQSDVANGVTKKIMPTLDFRIRASQY